MKVLLFVQNGDARPKCVKSFGNRYGNAMAYFNALRTRFGCTGQPERGWLVACESAAEGLRTIREAQLPCDCETPQCKHGPFGHILASGSKEEAR